MRKNQVQIGGTYVAKVSGQLASVRIDAESRHGGWDATNVATRRKVRIKSAQRLRREAAPGRAKAVEVPPQSAAIATGAPDAVEQLPSDPAQCATADCDGAAVMTYLGRPLCRACWDVQCNEKPVNEAMGDADRPVEKPETTKQENEMSKKTSKKAANAPAKAKGSKKTPAPKAKAVIEKKPKRLSAIDAAAQVLAEAKEPMRAQDLITAMAEKGLWSSPAGKTPHATLYAAMVREINTKGKDARFKKVDRGMFEYQPPKSA